MYIGIPVLTEKPGTAPTAILTHAHTSPRKGATIVAPPNDRPFPLGVPWPMISAANPSSRLRSTYDRACIVCHSTWLSSSVRPETSEIRFGDRIAMPPAVVRSSPMNRRIPVKGSNDT